MIWLDISDASFLLVLKDIVDMLKRTNISARRGINVEIGIETWETKDFAFGLNIAL